MFPERKPACNSLPAHELTPQTSDPRALDRELLREDPYRRAHGERDSAHGDRGGCQCTPTLGGRPTPPLRAKRHAEAAKDDRCAEEEGEHSEKTHQRADEADLRRAIPRAGVLPGPASNEREKRDR